MVRIHDFGCEAMTSRETAETMVQQEELSNRSTLLQSFTARQRYA